MVITHTQDEIEQHLDKIDKARGRDFLTAIQVWSKYISTGERDAGDILAKMLLDTSLSKAARLEALVLGLFYQPSPLAREKLEELLFLPLGEIELNRENIVEALGALGDPDSVPALVRATHFEDEYGHLRVKIAWALGRIEGSQSAEVLRSLTNSNLVNVAQAAHLELTKIHK